MGDTRETDADEAQVESHVERVDTMGLVVLYPDYSTIDFVCGTMPAKTDSSVILVAEAAYTGECLKEFRHSNIAGGHVSAGVRYRGYRCKRIREHLYTMTESGSSARNRILQNCLTFASG